ncbi:MAG TPA: trypsin-like serine protease [Polyangia bacterium]|nr:trypsin-like serine protease [Polyangia bacterium]
MKKFLFLFAVLGACGGAEDPAATEEPIQGGKRDPNDPAVGLVWFEGGGFCSGALIAPNVVMTAGHCVGDPVAGFYTGTGSQATDVGALPIGKLTKHAVSAQLAHPSYSSRGGCPNSTFDVGLLRLAKPITGVKPLGFAAQPPKKNATCSAVGYGMHDDGTQTTVEQKRRATETVEAIDATSVLVKYKSGIVDHGDSGGPLLCGGKIAGATSCGTDGSGADHVEAYYARTDTIRDWIAATVDGWR